MQIEKASKGHSQEAPVRRSQNDWLVYPYVLFLLKYL